MTPSDLPSIDPPEKIHGMALFPLREVFVKARGMKMQMREVRINVTWEHAFQRSWKANKQEWVNRGYSQRCKNGSWYVQQWLVKTPTGYALPEPAPKLRPGLPAEPPPIVLSLPPLPNGLEDKLFEYQRQHARELYRALMHGDHEYGYPGAWDGSDLGTGKTYQALAAALATGLEVGVICPLAVIPAWKNAFKHFGACPRFVANYESLRTGNRDWVDMVKWTDPADGKERRRFDWKINPRDTMLIFDEAHNMKTTGSLNQGLGMAALRIRCKVIFVSGTIATDPTHMRCSGRAVGLHRGSDSYFEFLARHSCWNDGSSKWNWKFQRGRQGTAALASIHRMVFPRRGTRTRIADLGDRFPETQIMAEALDTGETAAIAKAFREAEERLKSLADLGMSEAAVEARRNTEYMKAWHESERAKIPTIAKMVQAEMEEGRSVAIFVNFTDVRESLMVALQTNCAIFGGQKPQSRQECIEAFQSDKQRVIVANIDAGGVGVSLHDINGTHPRTAIILPTNKVVSISQALGRVHRAGGKSKSRQIILFAAGTVEEEICATIRARMADIATLNDGDIAPKDKF